jgi:hypothetical protein
MDKNNISIATLTWARNAEEDQLLRDSLHHLAALNIPAYVTDGGSGKQFVDFLHGFTHFNVFEADAPGVWPQVRRSIRAANESAAKFILYTEPDKGEFFRSGLPGFISEATEDDGVGVVLASRSAESFATFPEFQQHTETTINRCCAEVVGEHVDFTYGPFLLNRKLVPYLDHVASSIGWGWRPYAFGIAHRLGYRIESIEKSLPCPVEQREDNGAERIYRMKQLSQNIQGLIDSTTAEALLLRS